MKIRNSLFIGFVIIIGVSLVTETNAQKRKPVRKTASASKQPPLTQPQKEYLDHLIDAAKNADSSYAAYIGDSLLYRLFEAKGKGFDSELLRLIRLDLPECETLPEPVASQVFHLKTSYSRWQDLFRFIDWKSKGLNYAQYEEQYRSILETSGFSYPLSQADALRLFKTTAQSSRAKLEEMYRVYPRWMRPDTIYSAYGNNIILVPVPVDSTSIAPCDTNNKKNEVSFQFKDITGKWKVTFIENGKVTTGAIFIFSTFNNENFVGIETTPKAETLLMPIHFQNGKFSFVLKMLQSDGQIRLTKIESNYISANSLKGAVTININGKDTVANFEGIRAQ